MISIVIPTYGRDKVLCDTIHSLLTLNNNADELVVVDQTSQHDDQTLSLLTQWSNTGAIRWIRLDRPSITAAMNRGAQEAKGDIVLFLDDDIIPHSNLIAGHRMAHRSNASVWAVVGQVLQPDDWGDKSLGLENHDECSGDSTVPNKSTYLVRDLDFPFNGSTPARVENVMAGNLSVHREHFLSIGGFDENFKPPVSFRFETEFAKRLIRTGGQIHFEPLASIKHLRAAAGGTRSQGSHLTSASPIHGVGDYYYALRCGRGLDRLSYILRRPFREVRTRFHLHHPWWIPVKFTGELRALVEAIQLHKNGPRLLSL